MPLEALLDTIQTVQAHITKHKAALFKNEGLTRYALIDPLLRALEWDTGDPEEVIPEYPLFDGKRADYALMIRGTPRVLIEAKRLGEPMGDAVKQGIEYCQEKGTPYLAVTNGEKWELYETHNPMPRSDETIVEFDLREDPSRVCRKALALWRRSVAEEHFSHLWVAVTEASPTRGTPRIVQFPDGVAKAIRPSSGSAWKSLLIEVTRWCDQKGFILPEDLPLPASNPQYSIVAASPEHPNKTPFATPEEIRSGLWIPASGGPVELLGRTKRIIEHAGKKPADCKVQLSDQAG